jgi:hypothetical protein
MGADVGGARLESIPIFIQLCLPETGVQRLLRLHMGQKRMVSAGM